MRTSTCDSCGAPIRWAVTAPAGKRMPLDLDPVEDGNVTIMLMDDGRQVATVHGRPDDIKPSLERYKSHFATCPNAAQHRRR